MSGSIDSVSIQPRTGGGGYSHFFLKDPKNIEI